MGFSPDLTDDEARTKFLVRYGYAPLELRRSDGALLAGPIRKVASET